MNIDFETMNEQMVGRRGDDVVVLNPKVTMTRREALIHAAWLVALSADCDVDFDAILQKVQAT